MLLTSAWIRSRFAQYFRGSKLSPRSLAMLAIAAGASIAPLALKAQTLSFAGQQSVLTATVAAPQAVAIDASGNRYILSHLSGTITEISATGVMTSITPAITPTASYPSCTATHLSDPRSIAVDAVGNLYVADYSITCGVKISVAAGAATFVGKNLAHPYGIAVDSGNNVYIANTSGSPVVKVAQNANGVPGPQSLVAGTYTNPVGLAVDSLNNLYVSDVGAQKVFKVTFGSPVTVATVLSGLSNQPYDVAVDQGGDVFLSGGTDHQVTMYQVPAQLANGTIRQLGTAFQGPAGIALDGEGNLYVADKTAVAVDIIAPGAVDLGQANLCPASGTQVAPCSQSTTLNFNLAAGASLTSVKALTQGGQNLDFTTTASTCTGITGPASCSVTVQFQPLAPGMRLGAIDVSGTAGSSTSAVVLASVPVHGVGLGPLAGFDLGVINSLPIAKPEPPHDALNGVITDTAGNLYFINEGYSCIVEKYAGSTSPTQILAGSGICGSSPSDSAGSGGPATSAVFVDPWSLALDGRGDLFISDDEGSVIWEVDPVTQIITAVAGVPGVAGHTADGVLAAGANLTHPYALAVDGAGNVYFSDYGEETVREIVAGSGVLTTVAGNYNAGIGFSGDGGPATSAQLNNPVSLALDASSNLYIDDFNNNVIRKVAFGTGIISTVAGQPIPLGNAAGYSGDGGAATSALLNNPEGIATDPAGNLYIADTGNYVVRKVSASTGFISTIAGVNYALAQGASTQHAGDGAAATLAYLGNLSGLALDGSGNLYLAETSLDGSGSPTDVALRAITVGSGAVSFATYTIGTESPGVDVTLTNEGNAPLDLSALGSATDFNFGGSDTSCTTSTTLSPGTSCVLGVQFLPTAVGPLTETLTLTDNGGNNPTATQSLSLTGIGGYLPTQLVVSAVPASVAAGASLGSVQATIESSGGSIVTNSTASVTATLTGPGNYSQAVTAGAVNGIATLNLSGLPLTTAGTYTLTVTSSGLPSATATVSVTSTASLLAVSALPSTILTGGNLGVLTATIEAADHSVVTTSTASVTATLTGPGNYSQAVTAAAVSGIATLNLSGLPLTTAGTYTLSVTSSGLPTATATVSVTSTASLLAVSALPSTIPGGGNLGVLTATIEAADHSIVTTSSASVTTTLTGPNGFSQAVTMAAVSGVATLDLSSLALQTAGVYTVITSSPYLPSATATVSVISPDFTLALAGSAGSTTQTVAAGASASYALTVAPASGSYPQAITLTASGLPPGATYTFAPATITPGSTAASTTLTIQTAASAAVHKEQAANRHEPGDVALGGMALALLLLPLGASRRLRNAAARLPLLVLACALLSLGAVGSLAGCGGSSSSTGTPPPASQTYTITVTGTSGALSHSTTVTLIVQ